MLAIILMAAGFCQAQAPDLERAFAEPPASAAPWVYWFWLNGNITREGITADLEAMKQAGIGGVLIMEVDQGVPRGPLDFMSDTWRGLFAHVVAESQRLGLEVNMNNDAGWNGSGGPWIKPEQSMQKVVWTEREVEGPARFEDILPQPETVAGYYHDIATLAFPTPGPYRIENIRVKACFESGYVGPAIAPAIAAEMCIDPARIADITAHMEASGRVTWDVPEGKWTIIRFGHTSTGVQNAPAPESGRGLECDKLSKEGIEANFNGMMAKLIEDAGPLAGKALAATHIDSWENGAQNWTLRMREEFKARRGYDLLPYLPAITARVVGTLELSERFLWDFRQTISEMIIDNYAGHLQTLAARHGLRLSIEAYGGPCYNAPYASRADEPMCEFWVGGGGFPTPKEMASAAHTYGRPILGAEAFTAADKERWQDYPGSIKALGDRAFCDGVNRFVFHRYALQPWLDRRPGMTMGPWGVHYERTQTWWAFTPSWHRYLARCQHMLRQGHFVADICYLQPEAAPQSYSDHKPKGYDFDNCSPEVVMTRMSVKDGHITLPDGMCYRLLVLPDVDTMTPALLARVRDLVRDGATVIGRRPLKSPSLQGYPACDAELKQIADELWGTCDGVAVTERQYGNGRIIWMAQPEKVLAGLGIPADFTSHTLLNHIHRRVDDTDFYFVANPKQYDVVASCTFGVTGKTPELWWPDSGMRETAPVYTQAAGGTTVLLPLAQSASVFVVFKNPDTATDPVVSVSRDGEEVFTVLHPMPRITVEKALYGVLDDPGQTRDVREAVQRRADSGAYAFVVADLVREGDPAPQKLKALRVDYTIDGKHFTVRGTDPDTVHLTVDAERIVIHSAVYGVPGDPVRTRDVREKVQRIVDAGESSFEVARLAQGDDPAFMVVKTATIAYSVDGKEMKAVGTDPEVLYLALPPPSAEAIATVSCRNGKRYLEPWKPGVFDITRASGATRQITAGATPAPLELAGPWDVAFEPATGAPAHTVFETLAPWNEHAEPAIKYYSGIATYTKTFVLPNEMLRDNRRIYLDLGNVQVMAAVKINGHAGGTAWESPLWKPPFRIDITAEAKAGENTLEIAVANLWINRMIGDEQLPEDSERYTEGNLKEWPRWLLEGKPSPAGRHSFTTWRLWHKDEPLKESGLMGPVVIRPVDAIPLE